jgi:hypothetical protein
VKSTETVRVLGLYASSCCQLEALFDIDDTFSRCPKCERLCRWEFVEKVISWQELEDEFESIEIPLAA